MTNEVHSIHVENVEKTSFPELDMNIIAVQQTAPHCRQSFQVVIKLQTFGTKCQYRLYFAQEWSYIIFANLTFFDC